MAFAEEMPLKVPDFQKRQDYGLSTRTKNQVRNLRVAIGTHSLIPFRKLFLQHMEIIIIYWSCITGVCISPAPLFRRDWLFLFLPLSYDCESQTRQRRTQDRTYLDHIYTACSLCVYMQYKSTGVVVIYRSSCINISAAGTLSLSLAIGRGRDPILSPIPFVHPFKCLLDLMIPVTERNDEPLEDPNKVQSNALSHP